MLAPSNRGFMKSCRFQTFVHSIEVKKKYFIFLSLSKKLYISHIRYKSELCQNVIIRTKSLKLKLLVYIIVRNRSVKKIFVNAPPLKCHSYFVQG